MSQRLSRRRPVLLGSAAAGAGSEPWASSSVSMFPQIALVGPLYLVAANLDLLDTYMGLVLVCLALGLPLVTWVLCGYFDTLPREIDESARIDGVGTIGLLAFIAA